jgi:Zn-finger nucleic acid-binding protein
LTELKSGSVVLDACHRGCGGVWFDAQELEKVNMAIPAGTQTPVEVERGPSITVDEQRIRKCVHCRGIKLERKLFSLGTGVIMDCCPKCHGLWLDAGELDSIREETNPTPRPVRNVVSRRGPVKKIPINFDVVQKVHILRVSK